MADPMPVHPQLLRRSLPLASIGLAALVVVAVVPNLRQPWILNAGGFSVVFGLVMPAAARARSDYVRFYMPMALAFAVGQGLAAGVAGRSLRQGVREAVGAAAVWALLIGLFAILDRRPRKVVPSTES